MLKKPNQESEKLQQADVTTGVVHGLNVRSEMILSV